MIGRSGTATSLPPPNRFSRISRYGTRDSTCSTPTSGASGALYSCKTG